MICDKPKEWVNWLPLAKYCYNISFHHSSEMTHFEAMFGYLPTWLLTYMLGTTQVVAVEDQLKNRDAVQKLLHENLQKSQN